MTVCDREKGVKNSVTCFMDGPYDDDTLLYSTSSDIHSVPINGIRNPSTKDRRKDFTDLKSMRQPPLCISNLFVLLQMHLLVASLLEFMGPVKMISL